MDGDTQDEHYFNVIDFELIATTLPPFPVEKICQAVSIDSKAIFFEVKNGDKMKSKLFCRFCQFLRKMKISGK